MINKTTFSDMKPPLAPVYVCMKNKSINDSLEETKEKKRKKNVSKKTCMFQRTFQIISNKNIEQRKCFFFK